MDPELYNFNVYFLLSTPHRLKYIKVSKCHTLFSLLPVVSPDFWGVVERNMCFILRNAHSVIRSAI